MPVWVLSRLFRRLFPKLLHKAFDSGKLHFFSSLEAVKAFAGDEISIPVFEPEARQLLSKVEPIARHYNVVSINSGTSPSSLSRLGNRPSM